MRYGLDDTTIKKTQDVFAAFSQVEHQVGHIDSVGIELYSRFENLENTAL